MASAHGDSPNAKIHSIFPPDLLDDTFQEFDSRKWWAFYTKSRQEKSLARDLFSLSVPFYLPLVTSTKVYRQRRVRTQLPVFGGYVFVFGSEDERVTSLKTNRVSRVLAAPNPIRLTHDLRQLRRLIDSGAPLTVESRLEPGDQVRIRHGSLAGLEGVVLHRRSGTRLLIGVDFLQQGVSVAIDDYMLEQIS